MAITATSTDSGASSTSTPTLALGFTANAGDLVIGAVGEDGAGTVTWPSPWVEIKDQALTGGIATVGYLIATGGETSVQLTGTVSERWEACFWRIPTGEWHGTTPPEINTGVSGSSTGPDPGSIAPSWSIETNNIFLALAFRDDSVANTITGYPTNYSTAQIDRNSLTSALNVGGAVRIVTGTNENPGAFTISASETWMAYTVAVRPAAAGTTVTPSTASLALTTFAPKLNLGVIPSTASLTLATFAPSVTVGVNVVPGVASLTLSTFAPTVAVSDNKTAVPGVASLTLTPFAPTVTASDHKLVVPGVASLVATAFAPTVTASDHKTAVPGVAALALTAFAPGVTASDHKVVVPAVLALALAAFEPTVTVSSPSLVVVPATASLALTAYAPDVLVLAPPVEIEYDALARQPRGVVRYPWYGRGLRGRS
jgi:hypothetical protein